MYFIEKTDEFDKWLRKLKDLRAKAKFCLDFKKLKVKDILKIVNLLAVELVN